MNDQNPNESTPLPQEPLTFTMTGPIGELFAALAKAQGAFQPIIKNKTAKVVSSRGNYTFDYASLDTVLAAVTPALSANGLAVIQPFAPSDECELRTMLVHSSGACLTVFARFPWPEEMVRSDGKAVIRNGEPVYRRTGAQGLASMMTYLRRYSLTSLVCVSSEEDDDGNAGDDNQRDVRSRGNPPPPPAKASGKPQERPPAAKAQTPKAEPAQGPGPQATPAEALAHAKEQREKIEAANAHPIETTGEDMGATIVDNVNGPDGEAVDDDRPEFRDPNPASDETKKLIQATQTKLLSLNGTGKDIALPLRIAILKRAAGIEATPGQKIALTEGEGQRIVAFLYEVATDLKIDPDGMVSQAEVKMAIKAFEKRSGLVS